MFIAKMMMVGVAVVCALMVYLWLTCDCSHCE